MSGFFLFSATTWSVASYSEMFSLFLNTCIMNSSRIVAMHTLAKSCWIMTPHCTLGMLFFFFFNHNPVASKLAIQFIFEHVHKIHVLNFSRSSIVCHAHSISLVGASP